MKSYRDMFRENGYVVVPNIIPLNEVSCLRNKYQALLDSNGSLTLSPADFLAKIGMLGTILNRKVISYCKNIVSERYVMYPDFTIRKSLYIPWHTDASYLLPELCNRDKVANFVQCSIYLQDNNEETGGGLEVIPGTHVNPLVDRQNPKSFAGLAANSGGAVMQSKAGGLVLWDSRIVHRSVENKNPDKPKLAVQWTISRNDSYSECYLGYLKSRTKKKQHVSDMLGSREERYLLNTLDITCGDLAINERKVLDKNNIFLSTVTKPKQAEERSSI